MAKRLPESPFVNVSRDCITQGWDNHCQMCPVALAIGHILPKGYWVQVFRDVAKVYDGHVCLAWYRLPKTATEFIDEFDNAIKDKVGPARRKIQHHFQPFGFRMTLL